MQVTRLIFKQTLHPPKRTIPLAANPLTRWSRRLPQWRQLAGTLTSAAVGLEGCHSAFNATNSIRTCLYFQTSAPPTFLTAKSWKGIEHVQTRPSTSDSAPSMSPASSVSSSSATTATMTNKAEGEEDPFTGIAAFGEDVYFKHASVGDVESLMDWPIVAVENFTDRAQSVMRTRLPLALHKNGVRLVVGHENWGVRRSLLRPKATSGEDRTNDAALPVADMVVYVPQYGTISSLNVVTSLGIALFYCYIDGNCPDARTLYAAMDEKSAYHGRARHLPDPELEALREEIQAYQNFFKSSLPAPPQSPSSSSSRQLQSTNNEAKGTSTALSHVVASQDDNVNTTPRVDKRPIHPVFYTHEMAAITARQQQYRRTLLRYSYAGRGSTEDIPRDGGATPNILSAFFGLSVLYENEYDQRNFGGLIRNANAFLVDHILYVGRRKYNVVGAVGSYHYTPPVYLGPLPSVRMEADSRFTGTSQLTAEKDCPSGKQREDVGEDEIVGWSACLKAKVDALYCVDGGVLSPPKEWWLLDCGHAFLYEDEDACTSQTASVKNVQNEETASQRTLTAKLSSASQESLQLYKALQSNGRVRSLCEPEDSLRAALGGGLVLLVPQEGKLPHAELMKLCTGVLSILPPGAHHSELMAPGGISVDTEHSGGASTGHRGLPSQVASGIALQRLSAVLHPRLAAI